MTGRVDAGARRRRPVAGFLCGPGDAAPGLLCHVVCGLRISDAAKMSPAASAIRRALGNPEAIPGPGDAGLARSSQPGVDRRAPGRRAVERDRARPGGSAGRGGRRVLSLPEAASFASGQRRAQRRGVRRPGPIELGCWRTRRSWCASKATPTTCRSVRTLLVELGAVHRAGQRRGGVFHRRARGSASGCRPPATDEFHPRVPNQSDEARASTGGWTSCSCRRRVRSPSLEAQLDA